MRERPSFNCADQRTPTWQQRAEVAAELLAGVPGRSGAPLVVADIGCGDQKLRAALRARGAAFAYRGYDLLPQAADVERFDVRADALPRPHDVAVLLGVLEYLEDLSSVLARLAAQVQWLLVSHVVRQDGGYSAAQLRALGWHQHLAAGELERLVQHAGAVVIERRTAPDGRTLLWLCRSQRSAPESR
jgi:hypothetical protein